MGMPDSSPVLFRLIAAGFLALGLVGAAALWVGTDTVTRLAAATAVVSESSSVIEETIETADAVIASVGEGLVGADTIVADISMSTDLTASVIDDASILLATDVADSVAAVEDALPGLIGAGKVIDDTLSALALFGVPYDAEVPFAVALADVDESLDGLADELRTQGAGLGEISEPVRSAGAETAKLAETLADVQIALADARVQLADYQSSAAGLSQIVESTTVDPELLSLLGKGFAVAWLALGVLLTIAAWQRSRAVVPLTANPPTAVL